MPEDNKESIYKFLEESRGKKFSMKQLNEKIEDISRATIIKWIAVLIAEQRIKVEDYGNLKLVWVD